MHIASQLRSTHRLVVHGLVDNVDIFVEVRRGTSCITLEVSTLHILSLLVQFLI